MAENIILSERNRKKLLHDGHLFIFDKFNSERDKKFWKCEAFGNKHFRCKARLHTDLEDNVQKILNVHVCNTDATRIEVQRIKNGIKRRAEETGEAPDQIRARALHNIATPVLAQVPSRNATNQLIKRVRREQLVDPYLELFKFLQCSSSAQTMDTASTSSGKTAVILVPNGCPETELATCCEILRRADVTLTLASVQEETMLSCAGHLRLAVDKPFAEVQLITFDAVVVISGEGGLESLMSEHVGAFLQRHEQMNKIVAAINAGPVALVKHGIARSTVLTSHPKFQEEVIVGGYNYSDDAVVTNAENTVVTSRGPGTAFAFALKLGELLAGDEKMEEVRREMLLKDGESAIAEQPTPKRHSSG